MDGVGPAVDGGDPGTVVGGTVVVVGAGGSVADDLSPGHPHRLRVVVEQQAQPRTRRRDYERCALLIGVTSENAQLLAMKVPLRHAQLAGRVRHQLL